jgi:uncharacterized membrane protein
VLILFVATRDGIVDRVVTGLDESYEAAQELFQNAPPAPDASAHDRSAASLIDWGAMGKPGRDFVTLGPTCRGHQQTLPGGRRWSRSASMSAAPMATQRRSGPNWRWPN